MMTNREWLNSLSDEELARVIHHTCCNCCIYVNDKCGDCEEGITEWLNKKYIGPMPELKVGDVISLLVDGIKMRDYAILSDKYAYGLFCGYIAEWTIVSKEIKRIQRINNNTGDMEEIWRADDEKL